jgi:hypothetical protein
MSLKAWGLNRDLDAFRKLNASESKEKGKRVDWLPLSPMGKWGGQTKTIQSKSRRILDKLCACVWQVRWGTGEKVNTRVSLMCSLERWRCHHGNHRGLCGAQNTAVGIYSGPAEVLAAVSERASGLEM